MGSRSRNGVRESKEVRKAIRTYRKEMKRQKVCCWVCGREWKWYSRFHVHHLYPVSYFPYEAANVETFRWVHSKCHLIVGHGGNWSNYQLKFDELADLTKKGLRRPRRLRIERTIAEMKNKTTDA